MPAMPKFTKSPPEVIAAFDAASPSRADVQRKTMFGYPALFLKGNMFAFTFGPKIAVRLDAAGQAKAMKSGATPFEVMPGRPMRAYVTVPASAMKGPALKKWIADGLACAAAMPTKAATKSTAAKKPARKPAKKK
jgi:TfoX/Sxy family transcriptional regulator of competence genes